MVQSQQIDDKKLNKATARVKSLRISCQKANLLLKMIRNKNLEDAIRCLQGSRKRIVNDLIKLIESAAANAENNHNLDMDRLYVKEAIVGKSMVMKRWRARARGRGARILKPMSNIKITLQEREE